MSDLHRAVQAEIAAHTPSLPPSFDALKRRKHRRDRRRTVAAVAASALAVAGVAFLPAALAGGGGTAPAPVAQDAAPAPALAGGELPCDSPRMFIYSLASTTGGAASPEQAAEQFGARPNAEPGYAGQTWTRGETTPNGEVQVYGQTARLGTFQGSDGTWFVISGSACPAGTDTAARTYTVQPSVRTVGNPRADEQRDACFALPGVSAVDVDESLPLTYRVTVPASEADAFEQCIQAVVGLYVPELDQADAGTSAQAFIDRCLGPSAGTAGEAGEYVGKTEAQAKALASSTGATIRVFGRDGTCLGGTRDLREDRVNVLLVRDQVIWAGRF